jgi:hypothetical protein
MSNDKLRRQITYEAARMLCARQESEIYRARLKAARRIAGGWVKPGDLPTNREIREEIQAQAQMRDSGNPAAFAPEDGLNPEAPPVDRFRVYRALLLPLETVKLDPSRHPEGDALYHSLQVFDLARHERPYDEEFLLAALLHDIGKGIDPYDHVASGLEALEGTITERTAWLIEHHMLAHQAVDGSLGRRAHRRLRENESFEDLMLLEQCDRQGRRAGVEAPELDEALDYIRDLDANFG